MTEPQRRRINENLRALENKVLALFGATYVNALNIPEIKAAVNAEDDEFDWSKYKGAEGKIEKMLRKLSLDLNTLVTSAVAAEYEHGADGASKEVGSMLGKTKVQRELVEQVCEQATNQRREQGHTGWNYVQARRGGLTLSERIWQSTRQAKQELRIMVQSGVIEGKTAQEISQDVRPNLIEPKRLFRRVRDKDTGELRLSKAAKEYHPGQGVYRSSFKNAMRVARTEVNQAYRVGEQQSYTNNPLVKGYEIMTSENNHTTTTTNGKKVPLKDICDQLAGTYPKTFVWSGWHPQCRCKMVPIPLTPEEFGEYMRKKKAGKLNEWKDPAVKHTPKNFNDWVKEHDEDIQAAAERHKLPYFLVDNPRTWGAGAPTPAELAAQRHAARTKEMEDDIHSRWDEHQRIQAEVKKLMEQLLDTYHDITYQEARRMYVESEERKARIQEAADKRHAQRTPEREKEIRDFWGNKKAEGEKRRRREQILEEAAKRHAARTPEQAQAIVDKLEKRRNQYAEWEKNIRDTEKRAKINEWVTDEDSAIWVDGDRGTRYHLRDYNEIAQELNRRMDVIDKLRPSWNLAAMHQSVFDAYREKLDEARRMITNGFEKNALDAMEIAKEIRAIEPRYVDMRTYQKAHPGKGGKKSKIELALDEAEALVKQGNIKGAELKIKEAENTRKINEASAKAKAEAARKKKEEAERLKAEEEARKNKQLRHEDCETIEDFRRLYGEDMPAISEHIDTSVKRDAYTNRKYIKDRAEIEMKLKEFWKEVDFSHCTDPGALDGYFKDGILTNLQRGGDTNTGYNATRRSYGHFAFDLPGNNGVSFARVEKKYHLKPGEYYRCGVPCSKDPYEAFTRDNSGYGDAQLVFRKDRIITTFTMGNSYAQHTIPSLTTDPKVCSLDNKIVPNIRDEKYTIERLREGNMYCEVQYLPRKSQGNFTPKDFQRITMREHPERYHPKELWEKWANEGVDIYYIDRNKKKAILYMKGKPQITHEEAKSMLDGYKSELDVLFKDAGRMSNKDVSIAEMQAKIKSGDYIGALEDYQRFKDVEARRQKIVDLIPDADKFHKEFTIDELEAAHRAIKAKLDYMDNTFKARNTPDDVLNKWTEEIDKAEHPEKYKAGSKRFPTWEIAKNAYVRRRNQLVYEFHQTKIDDDLRSLRSSSSKNKEFLMKMTELEDKVKTGEWATVETIIEDARAILKRTGEVVLKLGESSKISFSAEEFSQAARDAAKWFKDPNVKAAYKAADDYMSKYAQDMWKSLTDEEKHVLWLYTDGSKYINEEMLGQYGLRCISPFDGTVRNGLADANVITSIIEKAPALKESMWMQSGKSLGAFKAMFGIDISSVSDPTKLVGMVGTNNIFSSCHASSDGYFTKGGSTGTSNPIVISIYMPKGTKGVYLEPFASYGDNLRWKKGLSWTGTKRREAPSDQVEFLLQRGAKFKITKAYYSNGKWYVDVDLIEQSAVDALNETIPGLMNRPTRISRKPTLI